MNRKVGCIAALLLACGLAVSGATLRVPGEYATIQAAVDAAKSGDVVLIAPGVYEEAVRLFNKTGIILKGDVAVVIPEKYECCPPIGTAVAAVRIRGLVSIVKSTNITVETLTIAGLGIVIRDSTDVTIRFCSIIRNVGTGLILEGSCERITVVGSDVSYNGQDGINLRGSGFGFLVEDSCINYNGQLSATGVGIRIGRLWHGVTIRRNCIVGNVFAGIHPE